MAWWQHIATKVSVSAGLGNGLLPDDTNPLTQLMMTYDQLDPGTNFSEILSTSTKFHLRTSFRKFNQSLFCSISAYAIISQSHSPFINIRVTFFAYSSWPCCMLGGFPPSITVWGVMVVLHSIEHQGIYSISGRASHDVSKPRDWML